MELIQPKGGKLTTRKRIRHVSEWKSNVRKEKRARGEGYLSARNKIVPPKVIKNLKDCTKCMHKCDSLISKDERKEIFSEFYKLNDLAKKMFLTANCMVCVPLRRRSGKNEDNSRKKVSFKYFFTIKERKIQVCKQFFLGTLAISQKTVYCALQRRNSTTNTPQGSIQGKHTKRKVPEEMLQQVKNHINSFARVESHYCRADSRKEYLESGLTITKMYELYSKKMDEENLPAVKSSFYRNVFCEQFNLSFHKPKKDRCEICELDKLETAEGRQDSHNVRYLIHIRQKEAARNERNRDRESKNKAVVTFDMENVLSCPKAEVSSFYYLSKLSVYNLTAHFSVTGRVYCAIWPETLMGRRGNDIASALVKILTKIIEDNPETKEFVLWSDSCVPQNRNSVISYALCHFMMQHNIESVTIKYSTPGHSCVQEIDSVHSVIERVVNKAEYYSPLSLLRLLLKVNSRKPYKVLQMRPSDFFDYQTMASNCYDYSKVPFTKTASLQFKRSCLTVGMKESHEDKEFKVIDIKKSTRTRKDSQHQIYPNPKICTLKPALAENKRAALKKMLPYMPKGDQEYYKSIPGIDSNEPCVSSTNATHKLKRM